MFAHFGHKWMCLHWGPYWQYEVREDECSASGIEESKPSQGNIIQDALELSGIDISSTDYDIVGNEQVEGDALHTYAINLVVLANLKRVAMDILPPVGCFATYIACEQAFIGEPT